MKLYEYYRQSQFLPTFANFEDEASINRYEQSRRDLFNNILMLPPAIFRNAEMLEFGPDTGENAVVFARWGANLFLAEPNETCHSMIRSYFDRFAPAESLRDISTSEVESFKSDRLFDCVIAEGFIYTIQPSILWLESIADLLKPEGLFVISYYEKRGAFLELLWKAIYRIVADLDGSQSEELAWRLFGTKWNSIPHTRKFSSWVGDVLQNPLVRLKYALDASSLTTDAQHYGFDLYSSWPIYNDPLDIYWHKDIRRDRRTVRRENHLKRISLGTLFGRKLYLTTDDADELSAINDYSDQLIMAVDRLIDGADSPAYALCKDSLSAIETTLHGDKTLVNQDADIAATLSLIRSVRHALEALERSDVACVIDICNSDNALIEAWGLPTHFAVFQKFLQASS